MKLAMMRPAALAAVAIAALGTQALAAPAGKGSQPQVTVDGHASPTCVLGGWSLASGPSGAFTPGTNATFSYDASVMVTSTGVSNFSGNSGKVVARAPLVCNTAMGWTIGLQNGALALQTPPSTVPTGFSTRWLYHLHAVPEDGSNNQVGVFAADFDTNGHPLPLGPVFGLLPFATGWGPLREFEIDFTPQAISGPNNKMIAGTYSESITLQVGPLI